MNTDPDAMEKFMEAAAELTGKVGPQRPRHLYAYAGYAHVAECEAFECAEGCTVDDGMLMWIGAVSRGLLIGDGEDHGHAAFRPYVEGEECVTVGTMRLTPASAVRTMAREDQAMAEEAAMTDEERAAEEAEWEAFMDEMP